MKILTVLPALALFLASCGGGSDEPIPSTQITQAEPTIIGQDNRLLLATQAPYVCHTGFVSHGDDWRWIFMDDGTIVNHHGDIVGSWQDIDGNQYWLQTDRVPWLILERMRRSLALNYTFDSETGAPGERYGTCRRDL